MTQLHISRPQMREKNRKSDLTRITYDLREGGTPAPGNYLVTLGHRGIGSVYQIVEARRMRSRHQHRWMLACLRAPDMRERCTMAGSVVVIPGETVWRMYWYSRESKQNRRSHKHGR